MTHDFVSEPLWSTAAFGPAVPARPLELQELGKHLHLCQGNSGRIFSLRCKAAGVHGFLAERLMTTLVLLVSLVSIGLVLW
jgi:hypothetical protein